MEQPEHRSSGQLPSDYRYHIAGSGTSDTTLSVPGDVNGVLQDLDLSLAAQVFTGLDEFVTPDLFNGGADLRIIVNMVDWLSFRPDVFPTSPVLMNAGGNDLLPGITVFDASDGSPFTGLVDIEGVLDGRVRLVCDINGDQRSISTMSMPFSRRGTPRPRRATCVM